MTESVEPKEIFQQRCEYHRSLTTRRWQYFTTLLLFNGLLLNNWGQLSELDRAPLAGVVAVVVLTCISILRLLSRVRRRIAKNAAEINALAGVEIHEVGKVNSFAPEGITFWMLVASSATGLPWLFLLLRTNPVVFMILSALLLVTLVSLKWRH